jgi:FkbM family methyltransferase
VFGHLLPKVAYPVIRGPLKGIKIILGSLAGEGGGVSVYLDLVEKEQTEAFLKTLKAGQVCFDIGANVGYYTLLSSRIVGKRGRVFSFEPSIRNLTFLYRHTILNDIRNVTIIAAACSDTMSISDFNSGFNHATGHLDYSNESKGISNLVPTVTVDFLVEQFSIQPDVIKIDVEGAELFVLQGALKTLKTLKPKIFLSTHSDSLKTDCLSFLKSLDYKIEPLDKNTDHAMEFLAS